MKRILLDENIPVGLILLLPEHDVRHVHQQGWSGISNGDLVAQAERAGFDALVTADQNLRYQQNMTKRNLALVILASNNWRSIRGNLGRLRPCLNRVERGTYQRVEFGRIPLR